MGKFPKNSRNNSKSAVKVKKTITKSNRNSKTNRNSKSSNGSSLLKPIINIGQVKRGQISSAIKIRVEKLEISQNNEDKKTIYKFLFGDGKRKFITALAFDANGKKISEQLEIGHSYIIQGSINATTKSKKYQTVSNSGCDLFLNNLTRIEKIEDISKSKTNIQTVLQKLKSTKAFKIILTNVTIEDGTVYRYMGCNECTTSIRFPSPNGKYCCTKSKCSNKSGKSGRKVCTIIKNLKLKDDSGELEEVICFNKVCQEILETNDTNCFDSEAKLSFEKLLGATISIDLIATKNSGVLQLSLRATAIRIIKKRIIIDEKIDEEYSDDIDDEESITEEFSRLDITINPISETSKLITDTSEPYILASKPPGLALVINIYNFPDESLNRKGSEIDVHNVTCMLKQLKYGLFEDKAFQNVDSIEIIDLIKRFKETLTIRKLDSLMVIIMSHGCQNKILMADEKPINLWETVIYQFSNTNFPEFIGKPKTFFVQACQDFGNTEQLQDKFKKIDMSDILVCFPSLPGHTANRNQKIGTRFINILCKVFLETASTLHLEKILKKVQERMQSYYFEEKAKGRRLNKQMCIYESIIFAEFNFPVYQN